MKRCEQVMAMVCCRLLSMLDNIITIDKSAVSLRTLEMMKQQSKQCLKNGKPGTTKAKVHAMRTKHRYWPFLIQRASSTLTTCPGEPQSLPSTSLWPSQRLLRVFKQRGPATAARELWFHWDNAPVHSTATVISWMVSRPFQVIQHPPHSLDLAPISMGQEGSGQPNPHLGNPQEGREGAVETTLGCRPLQRAYGVYKCCQKCVKVASGYFGKS